jgi:hypothetical protein
MKELFIEIESWLAAHPHGWTSKEKAAAIVGGILALRPKLIVEIGVWSGRSLIPMAMALKHMKSEGRIIAIDPWDNAASVVGQKPVDADFWGRVDHDAMMNFFLGCLRETETSPWVKISRCRSDEFAIPVDMAIDLIHIDGNHGEEASVYDVEHFCPKVRMGGLLFMDDVGWASKASSLIPQFGFTELYALDTGIMFQRTNYRYPPKGE